MSAFKSAQNFLKSTLPVIIKDPIKISPQIESLVHLKDRLIFQSALDAKIKIFVTGNTKHFDINQIEKQLKVQILTPKQAVEVLSLK
ncbi:MAG: hypothetical protein ACC618_01805 [Patescibacteria group bacterium]